MIIKLQERVTYGVARYYPGNELAYKFLDLMDQKSFTAADLPKLQNLGVSVQIAPPGLSDAAAQLQGHSKAAALQNANLNAAPTAQNLTRSINPVDNSKPLTITAKTSLDESSEADSHQMPIWQAPK